MEGLGIVLWAYWHTLGIKNLYIGLIVTALSVLAPPVIAYMGACLYRREVGIGRLVYLCWLMPPWLVFYAINQAVTGLASAHVYVPWLLLASNAFLDLYTGYFMAGRLVDMGSRRRWISALFGLPIIGMLVPVALAVIPPAGDKLQPQID